jgi:hypothetical protein
MVTAPRLVESGSEWAPARVRRCDNIPAPLRCPLGYFHSGGGGQWACIAYMEYRGSRPHAWLIRTSSARKVFGIHGCRRSCGVDSFVGEGQGKVQEEGEVAVKGLLVVLARQLGEQAIVGGGAGSMRERDSVLVALSGVVGGV